MKIFLLSPLLLAAVLSGCGDEPAQYGDLGLPSNCRALIAGNLEGWRTQAYTAEEALGSIARNCDEHGPLWK